MYILFAVIVAPLVLMMAVWTAVCVCRLCSTVRRRPRSRRLLPAFVGDLAPIRSVVPVGIREIREDRRRAEAGTCHIRYRYGDDASPGVPDAWVEELWRRRN